MKMTKYVYPFNLIKDVLCYDDAQIERYIIIPPSDLDATIRYVLSVYLNEEEEKLIKLCYEDGISLTNLGLYFLNSLQKPASRKVMMHRKDLTLRKLRLKASRFLEEGIRANFEKTEEDWARERSNAERIIRRIKKNLNGDDISIDDLNLSITTYNGLKRAGISFVSQIPISVKRLESMFVTPISTETKDLIRQLENFTMK